ncbi:MAG: hypothetical protein WBA54_11850 [Acidaminobacteraceae bacterium]
MKIDVLVMQCPNCLEYLHFSNWSYKPRHRIEEMRVKCPTCNQVCIPTEESFKKFKEDYIAIACVLFLLALPLALAFKHFWFDNSMFIIVFACTPISIWIRGHLANRTITYEKCNDEDNAINPKLFTKDNKRSIHEK